jgi:hypothetical protein
MSSGAPDPIAPGPKRALDALKAKLIKALENQAKATADLTKGTDAQKEVARKALTDIAKEIGEITESITAFEKKSSPKVKGTDLKDAPKRIYEINNFGDHVTNLFENAKPMVGPYPKPKDLRLPFGLDSLLQRKFPCDKTISEKGIKTAQEIIGNSDRVSELNPDIICKLAEEPDKCKTDAGVIFNSQCAIHRIVVSKSLEGLGESIKRDIEEAKAESLKKVADLHTSLAPLAKKLKGGPSKKTKILQRPKFPQSPKSDPNIERFEAEPDDWNLNRNINFLEFRFNSVKNKFYAEYYDDVYYYRIYGDGPEDIVSKFQKLLESGKEDEPKPPPGLTTPTPGLTTPTPVAVAAAASPPPPPPIPSNIGSLIDNFIADIKPIIEVNHKKREDFEKNNPGVENPVTRYRNFIKDSTIQYENTIKNFFKKILDLDIKTYKKGSDKVKKLKTYYESYETDLLKRGTDFIFSPISDQRYSYIKNKLDTLKTDFITGRNTIIKEKRSWGNFIRSAPAFPSAQIFSL